MSQDADTQPKYERHARSTSTAGAVLHLDGHRFGFERRVINNQYTTYPLATELSSHYDDVDTEMDSKKEKVMDEKVVNQSLGATKRTIRYGPPALLREAVAAVNAFIDSQAFRELMSRMALSLSWAESCVAPEMSHRFYTIPMDKLGAEMAQLVKQLDVTVIPHQPPESTMCMHSNIAAQTISIDRELLNRLYCDDLMGAWYPEVEALLRIKLLHELLTHFVPLFLSHLYQTISPPVIPVPYVHGVDRTLRSKAGEEAELYLCGYVLSAAGGNHRAHRQLTLLGAHAVDKPPVIALTESGCAKLIARFTSTTASLAEFVLGELDFEPYEPAGAAASPPSIPASINRSLKRRRVSGKGASTEEASTDEEEGAEEEDEEKEEEKANQQGVYVPTKEEWEYQQAWLAQTRYVNDVTHYDDVSDEEAEEEEEGEEGEQGAVAR